MDNPQVVKFCNEGLRPTANKLVEAFIAARQLLEVYDATGIEAALGDDPTYSIRVVDGSESDGRPPLSVGGVKLTMANLRALVKQIGETDSGTGLTLIQGVTSISPRYADR